MSHAPLTCNVPCALQSIPSVAAQLEQQHCMEVFLPLVKQLLAEVQSPAIVAVSLEQLPELGRSYPTCNYSSTITLACSLQRTVGLPDMRAAPVAAVSWQPADAGHEREDGSQLHPCLRTASANKGAGRL